MTTISQRETLSLVRQALREAFPQSTFTLQASRSKETDHGCNKVVFVKWTDGPNSSQVNEVIERFEDRQSNRNHATKPWDEEAKAYHLLDGRAVRFDMSRFGYKRELSECGEIDVMEAALNDRTKTPETTRIHYTTVVAQTSTSAERVQRVDQGAWERQDLLDVAAAAMVANGPAPTRSRARL